jgi:hypothetical protein
LEDRLYKEESFVRYLLGQLSEEEQTRMEEKYFDDKDWFEQLQLVESELIDSYVCDRLSERDREAFENGFLQLAERRERIEFAQAWKAFVEKKSEDKAKNEQSSFFKSFLNFIVSKPLRLIPVAVALLLMLGSAWLVFENVRLRNQLEQAQNSASDSARREQELQEKLSQERQHAEQLAKDLETERLNRTSPDPANTEPQNLLAQIIPFNLNSDTVRSTGGIQRLEISTNTKTVRLTMTFVSDDNKNVTATMKKVVGTGILNQAELKAQPRGSKKQAVWSLPAKLLDEGDYLVTLNATDEAGAVVEIDRYAFRVVKK